MARELALLDPWLLPWRVLYEVLSRMELAGEVRRGYFVEGLSGAQFALPEAAQLLQDLHLPSTRGRAGCVLLHSLDPANLYGSGAPFDIPLLDGGTRPLLRRAGNWLVLRAGRPVLLVEQQGKRLTALASASRDDVAAAVAVPAGHLRPRPRPTAAAQADGGGVERPAGDGDRGPRAAGGGRVRARLPGHDAVRGVAVSENERRAAGRKPAVGQPAIANITSGLRSDARVTSHEASPGTAGILYQFCHQPAPKPEASGPRGSDGSLVGQQTPIDGEGRNVVS